MPKFKIYGVVTGTAYLGEIEADSAEQAKEQAEAEHLDETVAICHQCSHDISDPVISSISVESDNA